MKNEVKNTSVIHGRQGPKGWPHQVSIAVSNLRRRSQAGFYCVAGMLGAFSGLLLSNAAVGLAELLIKLPRLLTSALLAGLSYGVFATVLGTSLYVAMERHQHQKLRWMSISTTVLTSLAAGAFTGATLQIISNGLRESTPEQPADNVAIVIVATWILVATLLGVLLTRNLPNLAATRGLAAGFFAGLVSLLVAGATVAAGFGTGIAYFVGSITLGGALGWGLSVAETRFRDAMLQVNWAPNDKTYVGLGPSPVRVGGGRDHIFIPGAPPQISAITMSNGRIEHIETASGKKTRLRDGNRIRINGLTMVVLAGDRQAPPRTRRRASQ